MTMSPLYPCAIIKSKSTGKQETHRHKSRPRAPGLSLKCRGAIAKQHSADTGNGEKFVKETSTSLFTLVFAEFTNLPRIGQ